MMIVSDNIFNKWLAPSVLLIFISGALAQKLIFCIIVEVWEGKSGDSGRF
jgi:hypothetical protein